MGTMNVGNGGTTGTISGNVLDRGTLNFNRSDAVEYGGIISDTGRVQQNGSGRLTLSGINTYTGATNVNAGTLNVNGSIAASSLTTVNAGATLGGNGTVGNTTINGGTLAPGNSIGTLAVQGNLVFTAAASYMVEVSPANADRTNVTGTATLGGATVKASFAAGTYVAKQYTIVNAAGGVNGTFNSLVTTDLPANFTSGLSYDSNNAYLNLALEFRAAAQWPQRQSAKCRQRDRRFFQFHRQHPAGVRRADAGGPDANLRRSGDGHAADHLQCDESVHGRDDRSVHRRARRAGDVTEHGAAVRR